ncbi:GntR family transcriptional regulator [Microbacteriaceae bacterium VKM Ac-2854]|nr:GntR family transcriptional regulator [Microbacteriaceae bacterium VKM Ac-2854]
MIEIVIDPESGVAPFEQVRAQVVAAVAAGDVTAGDRLPTVRGLADELGLAANTVAKAYRALEADGMIETRGRNGSFVTPQGDAAQQQAQLAARAFAERVTQLGLNPAEALALVQAALHVPAAARTAVQEGSRTR